MWNFFFPYELIGIFFFPYGLESQVPYFKVLVFKFSSLFNISHFKLSFYDSISCNARVLIFLAITYTACE